MRPGSLSEERFVNLILISVLLKASGFVGGWRRRRSAYLGGGAED
jgi:hypothetical protein